MRKNYKDSQFHSRLFAKLKDDNGKAKKIDFKLNGSVEVKESWDRKTMEQVSTECIKLMESLFLWKICGELFDNYKREHVFTALKQLRECHSQFMYSSFTLLPSY